jgi:hypothetical protein
MYGQDTSEAVQEHEAQCDQIVINLYLFALTEVPWPPATTTPPHLYLSSALPLGISRLHIPIFCKLFPDLVGFQTGNICVFSPAAGSSLPLIIWASS